MENNTSIINDPSNNSNTYSNTTNMLKDTKKYDRKLYFNGIAWGALAAVAMTIFVKLIETTLGASIGLMYMKYIILGVILFAALSSQKQFLKEEFHFSDGMTLGAIIVFVSSIGMSIINAFLSTISTDAGFEKFSENGSDVAGTLLISGTLFFETLVFGMILTFISLQYLKRRKGGEPNS